MKARLTLIGAEMYLNNSDKSISDFWTGLEDPDNLFDSTDLLNAILERCGQLEIRTGNPLFFYNLSSVWWKKWVATFNRWLYALSIEYAPLENYDRHEQIDEKRILNETHKGEYADHATGSSEDNSTGSSNDVTGVENKVSAFNSSAYEPANTSRTTDEASNTNHSTGSNKSDGNGTDAHTTDNTDVFTHTNYTHGNIGVTTSQQMLKAELDMGYWNLYNRMADIFANELLVRVW